MFKIWFFLVLSVGVIISAYGNMRDPTAPTSASMGIKEIIITKNCKEVLVGDKYLKVGDKLMDAKIVAITPSSVKLQEHGETFSVSVFKAFKMEPVVPIVNKGGNGEK